MTNEPSHAMTIHETVTDDGRATPTALSLVDGELALVSAGETLPLPPGALETVMARYGKPLDEEVASAIEAGTSARGKREEVLMLGDGRKLVRLRYLARFDVIARDYLVFYEPGKEPLCELAVGIAGALGHLAKAFARVGR